VTGFLDLSTAMILNDLEPPKDKREVLLNLSHFLAAAHISVVKRDEMAGD